MTTYQVFIKNTDSLFFDGEALNSDQAIESAKSAYLDIYPEEWENINSIEWSIVENED